MEAPSYVVELIRRYFPQQQWENALNVSRLESGWRANAHNPNGEDSRGLFQINMRAHPDAGNMFDPEANVAYAASLWRQRGWGPWSVARQLGLTEGIPGAVGRGYTGGTTNVNTPNENVEIQQSYPPAFEEHLRGIGSGPDSPDFPQQWAAWQAASGYRSPTGTTRRTDDLNYQPGGAWATLQEQMAYNRMMIQYNQDRLRLLDIPQMMQQTALQRHQQALNTSISRAEQTGLWLDPARFEQGLQEIPYLSDSDVSNIRTQIRRAGGNADSDVSTLINDWLGIVEAEPAQNQLISRAESVRQGTNTLQGALVNQNYGSWGRRVVDVPSPLVPTSPLVQGLMGV